MGLFVVEGKHGSEPNVGGIVSVVGWVRPARANKNLIIPTNIK